MEVDTMMASDIDDTIGASTGERSFTRYDLVLAVIPTAFLLAGVVSLLSSVPVHALMAGATAIGAVALLDGMFINPPRSGSGTT